MLQGSIKPGAPWLALAGALGMLAVVAAHDRAAALTLVETPTLAATHPEPLPPIAQRVPEDPLVVDLEAHGRKTGRHGGSLNTMIGRKKDVRLINVWGYARLVGLTENLELEPDILAAVDVEDERAFTFTLRRGHKWSDGHPFTAEDFRYFWEDIALNHELSPAGPPQFMLVDGKPPQFEVLDPQHVRYTWGGANPEFLANLAMARPPFIYRPAHYLKQFNPKYSDPDAIKAMAARERVRGWAPLHNLKDDMYNAENPDIPTLQPWLVTPSKTDRRVVAVRNPYFYRVTSMGQQLPYIDEIVLSVVDPSLIPTKTQAGDSDLQARSLSFHDIPVLKRGTAGGSYEVRLWPAAKANAIALYPNLTTRDAMWRSLLRDVRFRHALSLAVDRELINRVLYFGLATPSNNAVLMESPLFREELRTDWASYDIDGANALLDEMGLTQRNAKGLRLGPGGRPLELIVETSGESATEIDALELIRDSWREIGVELYPQPLQRDVLRNRAFTGDLVMSVWSGFDNGIPTSEMAPDERVPMSTIFLSGAAWGAYVMSDGESGEKPDYPAAIDLLRLKEEWNHAGSDEERRAVWDAILDIHAEETLSIGTVAGVVQPVVVSNRLQNVPVKGIYGWDPGALFGIYRMDEFFFVDANQE